MIEQHFLIEGSFKGSVVRSPIFVHGQKQAPFSFSFFCTHCGVTWANAPVSGSKWQVQGGCCKDCVSESPFVVPGSLLIAWEDDYSTAALSCPEVVRWEFQRHLDYYERRIAND